MSAREVLFELNICLDSELCVIDKGREEFGQPLCGITTALC